MNTNKTKGWFNEAKGAVKEAVGKVLGRESLEQKGKFQNEAGKAQAAGGKVKKDINKAIEQH